MTRYAIEGLVWWAGDSVYIETEERSPNGLPTEVCLNDFIKDHIKENSKITIVIDVEKSKRGAANNA